jgi:hypothetical protein
MTEQHQHPEPEGVADELDLVHPAEEADAVQNVLSDGDLTDEIDQVSDDDLEEQGQEPEVGAALNEAEAEQ